MKNLRKFLKKFFLSDVALIKSEIDRLSYRDCIIADHSLNRWAWPDCLAHVRPKWYEGDKSNDAKYNLNRPLMDYLKTKFTAYDGSRYHLIEHLGRSEEEFKEYWETSIHNPDRTHDDPLSELALRIFLRACKNAAPGDCIDMKQAYIDVKMEDENKLN